MMMGVCGYCDHDMKVRIILILTSMKMTYTLQANEFLGGVRRRLGGFYNFPVALFFPVLDMSNSNLVPVQSVSRMFTCPCDHENSLPCLLFLGAGSRTHGTPTSSALHG